MTDPPRGTDLLIVDNSYERWKVADYLREWFQLSKRLDVATGHFEIGGLLALGDAWQQVDAIRILMGDEVSLRTKRAFEEALARVTSTLDESLEDEKLTNHFLTGVPAIVEGLRTRKIQCRVYRKEKFHKAYITHARAEVVGAFALVGSSNLSRPGLTANIELNVQITGPQVHSLQEWYEQHWTQAEDVTPEILRTIERHVVEYTPFEVYAKALHEFFRGHEMTASEWEESRSRMFPQLDQYQKGVPKEVWEFHIGGYQVCYKWLSDRKGRTLSNDDLAHYQKIVVALKETIRLMQEVDEVIERHGGWPGAFQVASAVEGTNEPRLPQVAEPKARYGG